MHMYTYRQLHFDTSSCLVNFLCCTVIYWASSIAFNNCQCQKADIILYWNPDNAVHIVQLLLGSLNIIGFHGDSYHPRLWRERNGRCRSNKMCFHLTVPLILSKGKDRRETLKPLLYISPWARRSCANSLIMCGLRPPAQCVCLRFLILCLRQ